jgi:hypothetical protein
MAAIPSRRVLWSNRSTLAFRALIFVLLATSPKPFAAHASQAPSKSQDFSKSSDDLERRDQPVTDEDLRILQRADAILSSAAVWNRHDTRICKPEDRTWSLFCAMEKASFDVLGEYRHREVALQEVRFAVEEVTKGVELEHRMMDYNNLSSTGFEDIKKILKVATQRVYDRLSAQKRNK